jgi:ATP-dependent helicase Lhr and Lhr-like helicase
VSDICRLNSRVAQAFYGRFPKLWPAQEAAIRPILSRENVVVCAGTGSGKTEAILAPLVNLFWEDAVLSNSTAILYVAPTKALLNDVLRRIEKPLSDLGLRVGVRHGDRNDLKRAAIPHVLLTTPESLDVLLFGKSPALQGVRALILDEAHLLYNTQRGLQFSILVQRLRVQLSPRSLQWAALSATMSRLDDVRDFLFGEGETAQFLSFPAAKPIDAQIRSITSAEELVDLVGLLEEGRPAKLLMFADSRRTCERLAGILRQDGASEPAVFGT